MSTPDEKPGPDTSPEDGQPDEVAEPAAQESDDGNSNGETADESVASESQPDEGAQADESIEQLGEESSDESAEGESAGTDEELGSGDEDLPEQYELTAEDVEDEAIRGDFMLRWAVILLALLLGVREVNDTATLVRIRSGEAIRANGFWPPAEDPFSYTAAERTWVNLAWFGDVILSFVYGALGATGISLLTGLIAASTFYLLSQISRPGLPTWWGSVCAALALLACHLQMTSLPAIVTLLGAVWVLRNLTQWSDTGERKHVWCLIASLAIWSNLDDRAYIGAAMVVLYLLGTALSRYLRPSSSGVTVVAAGVGTVGAGDLQNAEPADASETSSEEEEVAKEPATESVSEADEVAATDSEAPADEAGESAVSEPEATSAENSSTVPPPSTAGPLTDLAIAALGGVVALMVNPFGWKVLRAPVSFYGSELPILRDYYMTNRSLPETLQLSGLLEPSVWGFVNHHIIAGLVLIAATLVVVGLAFRKVDFGLVLAFAGGAVGCLFCLQNLPVAALAAAAAATLAGQDWYREKFRQTYTTDRKEVLFSRGGRAATVVALAAVAWMAISGRLISEEGSQPGLGFSPDLAMKIDGSREDFDSPPAGELFTTRLDHGDLLIWHGLRTFVDSRIGLYTSSNRDLIEMHLGTRLALRNPQSAPTPELARLMGNRGLWQEVFDRYGVTTVVPRLWGSADYDTWSSLMVSPDWTLLRQGGTSALFLRTDRTGVSLKPGRSNLADLPFVAFVKECPAVEQRAPALAPNFTERILSAQRPLSSNELLKARHFNLHFRVAMQGMPSAAVEQYSMLNLAIRNANYALAKDSTSAQAYLEVAQAAAYAREFEMPAFGEKPLVQTRTQRYLQFVHAANLALRFRPDDIALMAKLAQEYELARPPRIDLAVEMARKCVEKIAELPVSTSEEEFAFRQKISDEMRALSKRYDEVRKEMEKQLIKFRDDEKVEPLQLAGMLRAQGFILRAQRVIEEEPTLVGSLQARLIQAFLFSESGQVESAAELFNSLDQVIGGGEDIFPWMVHAAWVNMSLGDYAQAELLLRKRIKVIEEIGDKFKGSSMELEELKWTLVRCCIEGGQLSRIKEPLLELQKGPYRPLAVLILNEVDPDAVIEVEPEPDEKKPGVEEKPGEEKPEQPAKPDANAGEAEGTEKPGSGGGINPETSKTDE